MLKNSVSNSLIFNRAGYFKLTRLAADGTPSKDLKDIYTAGLVGVGVIKTALILSDEKPAQEIIKIETMAEDPYLDIFLKGGCIIQSDSGVQEYINLSVKIPDNCIYAPKDLNGGAVEIDKDTPILVRDLGTGEDYIRTNGEPQSGEYTVSEYHGIFTFATTDKGNEVLISAGYKVENVTEFVRDNNASDTLYQLTLNGPVQQYDATNKMWLTEIYPAVKIASGKLASKARQISPIGTKIYNFQSVTPKGSCRSKRIFSVPPIDDSKPKAESAQQTVNVKRDSIRNIIRRFILKLFRKI